MAVKKTTRECYEVREDTKHGEWANITLHCWSRLVNGGKDTYYCGEIQIHSSFGSWAYTWTACADPFKEFLQYIEFDYAFGKFLGANLEVFSGEKTLREFRRQLLERRRRGELRAEESRELWDLLRASEAELTSGSESWVRCMGDIQSDLRCDHHRDAARFCEEPWEHICTEPRHSAVQFWKVLWPLFIAALKEETTQP